MKELMASPYFGVGLSVVAFWIGEKLHSKLKTPICNPLIVAIVLIGRGFDQYVSCSGNSMSCGCNLYKN